MLRRQLAQCTTATMAVLKIEDNPLPPGRRRIARHVLDNFSHGQLLVAGWGSIEPAVRVRELAAQHNLYLETFLAAAYPAGEGQVVAIVPLPEVHLPEATPRAIDELIPGFCRPIASCCRQGSFRREAAAGRMKPMHKSCRCGRIHLPFLAAADHATEPVLKMEGYRKTIRVDAACELAHQKLPDVARQLMKLASPASAGSGPVRNP